ncbi:hypothetical protein, partial [Flavobacterium sp.]
FKFDHADGSLCLEGEVSLVRVEFNEGRDDIKASPFPDEMRDKLEEYFIPDMRF